MDFAKRAYDHSYKIDPIVRTLLDTDFYKLLMLQFIWKNHWSVQASFKVKNRTTRIPLADYVDLGELREQLDHVKSLRFKENELIWLRGQTFYGKREIFSEAFIDFMRNLRLSDYTLSEEDGQINLSFEGHWTHTTLWEIYALSILNEMRYRTLMKTMKRSHLDIMYARAKVKLHDKLNRLNELPELNLTDFGTRRRHSFLWQEYCVMTAKEVLGSKFTGTSNVYLAMKHDLEAKGTNAHELPMGLAAMADSDEDLYNSQYKLLSDWREMYDGDLLVMLPDTYGTTQFLENIDMMKAQTWTGARPDSKEPIEAGEELIAFWNRPEFTGAKNKLIIFSDGLDVALPGHEAHGSDITTIYHHFDGRVRMGFGWGTMLTNDFTDCHPEGKDVMEPLSLVCKIEKVNHRPAVKLSDNYTKATGTQEEIERYRRVFGTAGMKNVPVIV